MKCGVRVDMTLTPAPLPWREREKGRGGFINAECGVDGKNNLQDVEQIKAIIEKKAERFKSRTGDVIFAGVEGGTVKIAPTGFCWR